MTTAFFAIALVIGLAALLGAWASFFRLPLILAYIIAGIVAGPVLFKDQISGSLFLLLQDLGLSLLLFLVGLEIKTDELKEFGREALTTGAAQIIFTGLLGFIFALILKFGFVTSLYVALALTFSSTVIVVKLLNEKRDFDSLYGKLSVSVLLLQDVVAIFFLIILSNFSGHLDLIQLFITLVVGTVLFGLVYYLNRTLLPYLFERLARNTELLFLSSLAWLFLIIALADSLNFSLAIGAFLAGLGLASLKEEHQIAARVRPLRDFFIVIFFIVLGSHLAVDFNLAILSKAVILSLFVLILKPLVVIFTLGRQGFRRRTAFMTGISLAQISEFSLILMFLGLKSGLLSQQTVEIVTLAALITIAISSYNLVFATRLYRKIEKWLRPFESKIRFLEKVEEKELEDHVVLIGAGRLGWEILKQLEKQDEKILVVDFNPTVINMLKEKGIDYLFGDITDLDILEQVRLNKARLVISTVFDPEDTEDLLAQIRELDHKPIVFVTSAEKKWAVEFYKWGADYVIIPRVLSGHQVAHLLTDHKLAEIKEGDLKKDHLEELHTELSSIGL